MSELIPASTVIPLRDTAHGIEVLMLRKSSAVAFGGMWVFPGGKIDPADVDPARPLDEEWTARRAAAREAEEEAALAVDPLDLVAFSHWTPPEQAMNSNKRFATWFFVCRAPEGEITIDGGEIHEDVWVDPAEMLERRHRGDIQLVPPTVVTLAELAEYGSVDVALATAASRDPFRYVTRVGTSDSGMVTMWSGDVAYEHGDLTVPGPRHRLTMADSAWVLDIDL